MSLTTSVKDELNKKQLRNPSARMAELITLLRFAGGLRLKNGQLFMEIDLDHELTANAIRKLVHSIFGINSIATVVPPTAIRKTTSIRIEISTGADLLVRNTGLLDAKRRPVRGLPHRLTTAPAEDLVGILRGAFLARGIVSDPGRSQTIEIVAPSNEAAMALVGACGRCEISAKTRDVRGGFRVVIRDADAIGAFLTYIGASQSLEDWREARATRVVRQNANRLVNFDDANLRRSAQAAVAACARVERAFEILGDKVPAHLEYAGRLRLDHRDASLDELGHFAVPIMTKDAVAGRIRRLLSLADKVANEKGIPTTSAGIPALTE